MDTSKNMMYPIAQQVIETLSEYLEDYLDILAAEQVLAAIESGEEKVLSLEEAEKIVQ
jgi:predicted DNA-binding protein